MLLGHAMVRNYLKHYVAVKKCLLHKIKVNITESLQIIAI